MKKKVVFISTLLPETNYSQYLCTALNSKLKTDLIIYADKNKKNLKIKGLNNVKLVWNKKIIYFLQIFKQVLKDKPKIIHLQQEINMYGPPKTSIFFPILLILLKLTGAKIIVTVHAVVEKKIINKNFVKAFVKNYFLIHPFILKTYFNYLFKSISFLSDKIIVHTKYLRHVLISNYNCSKNKIELLPMGVPISKNLKKPLSKKPYFLYFGYIVKRKGLQNLIFGFDQFLRKNPHAKFKLILAGGIIKGQEFAYEEIKELIENLKLEKYIKFTGFIDNKKIKNLYTNAYAILMPSSISISASGPLAQVFSYGKCVVASKINNFAEEIENKKDGILTDNKDWGEAINYIYKNPKIVKKIETNVIKKAQERSWENIALKHIALYEKN